MEKVEIAGLRPGMLDGEQAAPAIQKTIGMQLFLGFEMLDAYGHPAIPDRQGGCSHGKY